LASLRLTSLIIAGTLGIAAGQTASGGFAEINGLIRSQKYDQALSEVKGALRTAPRDARLWTLEGIIYSLKNSPVEGIAAFAKALKISPDLVPAIQGEVQLLYPKRDPRAVPLLQRLIKLNPKDDTAHEMLGMIERDRGNCSSANLQFSASRESVMNHPESLEGYGDCLVRLSQYQEAAPVFARLVELRPTSANARYNAALVYLSLKQYEEALKILEPLLSADQKDAEILSLASQAFEATGNTPEAVSLLRRAIVLNPHTVDYYVAFTTICLDHDSFQAGIDMINAGIQYNPSDARLYISRGLLYAQIAKYDQSEEDFKRAEQLDANQSISSYAADLAIVQRNEPDQALARVRSQLKAHPESPLLNFLLAKLLMNATPAPGSALFEEAMRACEVAIRTKPDLVDARDVLASMYMSSGRYDLAIEQSRQALQVVPTDETAAYHLLVSLRHTGQRDEVPGLVKRISELHQQSLQKEVNRKKYRLVATEHETP
jgi:tetratricopeptide (TPR) repeat protein